MKERDSEAVRRAYRLRKLIVTGRLTLPRAAAGPLVGPDCAYHLYRHRRGQGR